MLAAHLARSLRYFCPGEETFELVVFSSYEVVERAPYLGETRARIGAATWKTLDRATVEALIRQKV
jgi:hypothetical protein